ncbi:GTPase domain-containing protein [Curvibacter gracilis]|uniref:GTPase domain-containing protein n=1 Tax=Curvibacter gracilis TaxID=230310 RepID=UPI0009FFDD59|nr:GTPase domain-containing protein [Curvibacter gracilis]
MNQTSNGMTGWEQTAPTTDLESNDEMTEELADRAAFVVQILSAKPARNTCERAFRDLLEHDVHALLSGVEVPSAITAEVLFRLQGVADKLELLGSSPALQCKTVVAVGGGFSSGKSSFITSFIEDTQVSLPVGIEPVTSIPTYVMPGTGNTIRGYTYKGGVIDIAPDFYNRLSHTFVHDLGFNLREILPFVAIETPLKGLEHLTFIDLPGYDAAQSEGAHTDGDQQQAQVFISQAQALIWLVGIDSNGEMPKPDLDFLLKQQNEERPLYVVLNKADLRPEESVVEVLEQLRHTLEDSGVNFEGLCAYSSMLGSQVKYRRKTLKSFLRELDQPVDVQATLLKELNATFRKLYNAMSRNAQSSTEIADVVNSLELDLHELGLFRKRNSVPIPYTRGRKRVRTPAEVAIDAQERLAYLREHLQSLEASDDVARAKKVADEMRLAIKAYGG